MMNFSRVLLIVCIGFVASTTHIYASKRLSPDGNFSYTQGKSGCCGHGFWLEYAGQPQKKKRKSSSNFLKDYSKNTDALDLEGTDVLRQYRREFNALNRQRYPNFLEEQK